MRTITTKPLSLALLLAAAAGSAAAQQAPFQPRMGEPLRELSAVQLGLFDAGRAEFTLILQNSQGLGPIFNDTGCAQCHSQPEPGGFSTTTVKRFGRRAAGALPFDPLASLGGSLLQKDAIAPACLEVVPPEADIVVQRQTPHVFWGLGAGVIHVGGSLHGGITRGLLQANITYPIPKKPWGVRVELNVIPKGFPAGTFTVAGAPTRTERLVGISFVYLR